MMRNRKRVGTVIRLQAVAVSLACLGGSGAAWSFDIPSDNEDIEMRLDNTVSYTAGWRIGGRDLGIAANPKYSVSVASDYFADQGDMYTSRMELFSEFDFKFKKDWGFRVSGDAWYDPLFSKGVRPGPGGLADSTFGPTGNWTSDVNRWYNASGEILDAFAFGSFDVADTAVSLKAGRTSNVWGESVFGGVGGVNSIGYGQNPNDNRKSAQNPSASLKQTVLPIGQVYANLTFPDNGGILSTYVTYEWRPDRVPNSGTYQGFADAIAGAPNIFCAFNGAFCLPYNGYLSGKAGDWGIEYKVRPSFLEHSAIAFAYRIFDEKNPWYSVWDPAFDAPLGSARNVYGRKTEIAGATFNFNKWDISFAGEINYRRNATLWSDFSVLAVPGVGGMNTTISPTEGARGDTWHALGNLEWVGGKALFWDNLTVVAEAAYVYLDKVTRNQQYYQAVGPNYAPVVCNLPPAFGGSGNTKIAGCANRSAASLGIFVDPIVYNIVPSWDMDIPVFYQANFRTSPENNSTQDGFNTLSAGVKMTWNTPYGPQVFELSYLGFWNKRTTVNQLGHNILGAPYYDRDQILLTYTATF